MIKDWNAGLRWIRAQGLEPSAVPHLLGKKNYRWGWEFITTRNRQAFLCGGNQIGKSSCLIRKNVWLATAPRMWKAYFPRDPVVRRFWYFYPSQDVTRAEWGSKWIEWMPNVPEGHPLFSRFGWTVQPSKSGKILKGGFDNPAVAACAPDIVRFNTGVALEFRTYSQSATTAQATTLHMGSADEELPWDRFGEIQARLTATDGIFNMGFTATLGQLEWYRTMMRRGYQDELFPRAWKKNISLYDCRTYMDGTPGRWFNPKDIDEQIRKLGDKDEIDKRVHGHFVMTTGRAFYAYDPEKVRVKDFPKNRSLRYFAVVDPGTGGEKGHPAGVMTLAVDYDHNLICVWNCWRGDGVSTTSNDIVRKLDTMTRGLHLEALIYDHASRDFRLTAEDYFRQKGRPISIVEAKKDRTTGFERVNSYLQAGALVVPDTAPSGCDWFDGTQVQRLHDEFKTVLRQEVGKKSHGFTDDLTDCLRYACMAIDLRLDLVERAGLKPGGGGRGYKTVGRHKIWLKELETREMEDDDEIAFWNRSMDLADPFGREGAQEL